ncbi:hypothetical protein Scep_030045 [Stephania cephalantha]|uniref:Uncharacterized protein n=1 Tax=Stephania cephalantha TaxID=152367 RepID=A0AAP0E6J9_9MAGN
MEAQKYLAYILAPSGSNAALSRDNGVDSLSRVPLSQYTQWYTAQGINAVILDARFEPWERGCMRGTSAVSILFNDGQDRRRPRGARQAIQKRP